jgi:hypothetical protein
MKRAFTLPAVVGLAAALFAADALADIQDRAVSGFSGLRLAVPAKVELIQGNTESLTIEGASEDLAKIETVVEDGTLHVRTSGRPDWSWAPKLRITLHAKRIDSLAISGAGDIRAKSLKAGALKLAIAGSGDIRIAVLEADSATVAISGSGDVNLAGRAATVTSHISGSGDLRAERLEARNVIVSIAGSGDVAVWAREALHVSIAGSGDVRYYGDPSLERKILGSGSVKRLGPAPT